MLTKKHYLTVLFFVIFLISNVWSKNSEKKGVSWKYLLEENITTQNNIGNKTEKHIVRACVHFGEDAQKANGQDKSIPYVVYIDDNNNILKEENIPSSYRPNPYHIARFSLTNELPLGFGKESQKPLPVSVLRDVFDFLPMASSEKLNKGSIWMSNIYMCPEGSTISFITKIKHEITGYMVIKGKDCAVIEYTIEGELKVSDTTRDTRGKFTLKGNGTAYYDPTEEIIIEKEQTIFWARFGEKIDWLDNGQVGWKPTVNDIETVNIKISLQSEKDNRSIKQSDTGSESTVSLETKQLLAEKPLGVALPVAGVTVAVVVIAGVVMFLRKKNSKKAD